VSVSDADWAALAAAVGGVVHRPGMRGYDPARAGPEGTGPAAVVRCRSAADVAAAIGFARRTGLEVAPGRGRGVVLDLSGLRSVSIVDGTARTGGSTRLGEVYQALATHRFTIPAGGSPATGIASVTLAGGIGPLGRRYGLTCDRLVEAEVVLADGSIVVCDESREPDLFWALRGAGPAMPGIVTLLRFAIVREPPAIVSRVPYPREDAAALIAAWQERAPDAADEITAELVVGAEPVVTVFGAPDFDVGIQPESDGSLPAARTAVTTQFFDRPLSAAMIGSLLDHLDSEPDATLEFVPMGGAYNGVPADATAFVHRTDRFLLKAGGTERWAREAWELARPDGTGRAYQGCPDPVLGEAAYLGDNLERLHRVQRHYDPDGVLTPARRGTAG
jgi:FAD/FMN-containing dehydrogenase